MKRRAAQSDTDIKARRWARRLSMRVKKIVAAHPGADPDNIRHTLILLELPPFARLQRSLIRGHAAAKEKLAIPVLRDALATTDLKRRKI
jgi:hypothetical protein